MSSADDAYLEDSMVRAISFGGRQPEKKNKKIYVCIYRCFNCLGSRGDSPIPANSRIVLGFGKEGDLEKLKYRARTLDMDGYEGEDSGVCAGDRRAWGAVQNTHIRKRACQLHGLRWNSLRRSRQRT